jgi:hypothetical protein
MVSRVRHVASAASGIPAVNMNVGTFSVELPATVGGPNENRYCLGPLAV